MSSDDRTAKQKQKKQAADNRHEFHREAGSTYRAQNRPPASLLFALFQNSGNYICTLIRICTDNESVIPFSTRFDTYPLLISLCCWEPTAILQGSIRQLLDKASFPKDIVGFFSIACFFKKTIVDKADADEFLQKFADIKIRFVIRRDPSVSLFRNIAIG